MAIHNMRQTQCDVVITKNHRVLINNTEIGMVSSLTFNQDLNDFSTLELVLYPTSIVHGDPPDYAAESRPEAGTTKRVDIEEAIRKARKRLGVE